MSAADLRAAPAASSAPRLRMSIRAKLLAIFGAVLLAALGTHLYLATALFTRDKLAYIYDLNASLVATLAEQTQSSLGVLAKEVVLFAREGLRSDVDARGRDELSHELFATESDVVRVELYRRGKEGFTRQHRFVSSEALSLLGITEADLDLVRRERPLPLAAIAAGGGYYFIQNASLPPDVPMLTLAFGVGADAVAAVDFRHDRLLRIFGRSKLHETMLVDERGEVLAHPEPAMVIKHANLALHPLVRAALSPSPVAQGVIEFATDDGSERLGAYSQVGFGRLVVLTQIPKSEALRASRELARQSFLFAVGILLAAFIASVFFSRRITAPIRRLRAATEAVGQGRFDVRIDRYANDEIGDLARAFEKMTGQLKDTQSQLVRSERIAAFGALGAGITHEVKNPITALVGFAQLAQKKIDNPEKVVELLRIIESEGLRCRDILSNFLKFARGGTGGWARLSLNQLAEDGARVLRHQLVIHHVKLELELAPALPDVLGNATELQQVLVNLAMNAQQAMLEGGRVRLRTFIDGDGAVVLAVIDEGPGIPEAIRDKIFEPFFTTKPAGEGTGLGLAISFSIVRAHKGTLSVESEVGKGSTFFIRLPPAPADAQAGPGTGGEEAKSA